MTTDGITELPWAVRAHDEHEAWACAVEVVVCRTVSERLLYFRLCSSSLLQADNMTWSFQDPYDEGYYGGYGGGGMGGYGGGDYYGNDYYEFDYDYGMGGGYRGRGGGAGRMINQYPQVGNFSLIFVVRSFATNRMSHIGDLLTSNSNIRCGSRFVVFLFSADAWGSGNWNARQGSRPGNRGRPRGAGTRR